MKTKIKRIINSVCVYAVAEGMNYSAQVYFLFLFHDSESFISSENHGKNELNFFEEALERETFFEKESFYKPLASAHQKWASAEWKNFLKNKKYRNFCISLKELESFLTL